MSKRYYVYILTNSRNTVVYTGITSRLASRIDDEHRRKTDVNSFTARYNVNKLVHVEVFEDPISAIEREKQIKAWRRAKKIALIESINKDWNDLYEKIRGLDVLSS